MKKLASEGQGEVDNIISEMNERGKRSSRVIAFNVQESKKSDGISRQEDDKMAVLDIVREALRQEETLGKVIRIGKSAAGKTRPRIVDVGKPELARKLLKVKPKEGSGVRFKVDLTKLQKNQLAGLRDKIYKEPDGNQTIRIINGLPRITSKNKNFWKEWMSSGTQ